jgi:hypothetical protein
MEKTHARVGIFIDGENVPYPHAAMLHSVALDFGEIHLGQVYAGLDVIDHWQHQDYFKRVLTPTGKNAADLYMCVDMIERACSGEFDVIIIASSDKDFAYAAETIRRMGITVIGVCDRMPSQKLQMACHHYINLEDNFVNAEEAVQQHLLDAIEEVGPVPLRAFESYIKDATGYGIIDVRAASWVDFIEFRANTFQLVECGPHVMIQRTPAPKPRPVGPAVPCSLSMFGIGATPSHTAVSWFLPRRPVPAASLDAAYRNHHIDEQIAA